MPNNIVVFGLPASKKLTEKICENLKIKLSEIDVTHFSDDEIFCRPLVSVRNKKVILIQSTARPVNDNLMTLLIAIDALKRASAREINVILPYFGYARQDRKSNGREPISAKLVADMITVAGASRVMIMDVHSDQIQGFFNVPVDTLRAIYILISHIIKSQNMQNLCIVSPDYGGVKRARKISMILNVPLAIIDKRRPRPGEVHMENVLGDVKNKDCILVDDMIDSGGTIVSSAKILKEQGVKTVIALATHGLFSGNAVAKFNEACDQKIIEKVYVTDSIETPTHKQIKCLEKISIAPFIADVINIYIRDEGSISDIYQKYQDAINQNAQKK